MEKPCISSSFESFLDEEGPQEGEDLAHMRVLAWQNEEEMNRSGIERVNGRADEHVPRLPNR